MNSTTTLLVGALILLGSGRSASAVPAKGDLKMDVIAGTTWRFGGEMGVRIDANVEHWLLRAPGANPGLIEMFHRRDRHHPYAHIVPWAGEFAGKYLISAVQARRMTDDPRFEPFLESFVDALVACQDEDGYIGPFRKNERLLGYWDLWGHYHVMLGLLMWHDDTGDEKALDCVLRAADCICDIYVDGERRPIEAGAPETNMAVLHVMAKLYGRTGNPRYLRLVDIIEEDIAQGGDWLRQGEQGVPYFKLPRGGPRWESLHIVQGFVEQYARTGEERYKKAAISLWESLRDYDRHPSGAFSTNESAVGSPYAEGSIETCCSVAWLALTIDVLRLTGDARVADELELTTWNQNLGAQHPSGSWWTYDTPINGVRVPSYHHINFQYRPGSPELNCCSVNAPRGLGMLSEWAVMQDAGGLVVNYYGPYECTLRRNGTEIKLKQETKYPLDGTVRLTVLPKRKQDFTLRLRIPEWSKNTAVTVNGKAASEKPQPGTYLALNRTWRKGDQVELELDMSPRHWAGQGPRHGRAAIYAGPLLLAFDAYHNEIETAGLGRIDVRGLELQGAPVYREPRPGYWPPMGLWRTQAEDGATVVLCDFASAGAHGTDYVAWLPAVHVPPSPVGLRAPAEGALGAPGPILFAWTNYDMPDCTFELVVATDRAFKETVARIDGIAEAHATLPDVCTADGTYYWKVLTVRGDEKVDNRGGPRSFRVDHAAPHAFFVVREDGLMAASALDGNAAPSFGVCETESGIAPAPDRFGTPGGAVALDGKTGGLRYAIPFFPGTNYSFHAWVCPEGLPTKGLQQVFSAWCRGLDDPLRVTFDGDSLFARLEAGGSYGTAGVPMQNGEWIHAAAVKQGGKLTLYVNGQPAQSAQVPERVFSESMLIGIGYNPLYPAGERFIGKISDFALYAKALAAEDVVRMCETNEQ